MNEVMIDALIQAVDSYRLPSGIRDGLLENLGKISGVIGGLQDRLKKIDLDQNLSDVGKTAARQSAVGQALAKLEKFSDSSGYRNNARQKRESLLKDKSFSNDTDRLLRNLLDFVKGNEIRDGLRRMIETDESMSLPESRDARLFELARQNPDVGKAILSDPLQQLVSSDTAKELEQEILKTKNPELYSEIEAIENAISLTEQIRSTAINEITDLHEDVKEHLQDRGTVFETVQEQTGE